VFFGATSDLAFKKIFPALQAMLCVENQTHGLLCYFILNAFWGPLEFELPPAGESGAAWRRWIDTALDSPEDIVEWQTAPVVATQFYRAMARSVVAPYAQN
jgi:glycogen operon protein